VGDGNLFPGLLPFPTVVDDDRLQAIDKFLFKPGPYLDPPDPASTAASHASTSEAASSAPASAPMRRNPCHPRFAAGCLPFAFVSKS